MPTLTHMFRQATTNSAFEQPRMQFSAGCCRKNTSSEGAIGDPGGAKSRPLRLRNLPCKALKLWKESARARRPASTQSACGRGAARSSSRKFAELGRGRLKPGNTSDRAFFGDDSLRRFNASAHVQALHHVVRLSLPKQPPAHWGFQFFCSQNWYMPAKVSGFSVSRRCQRSRSRRKRSPPKRSR
jgi:hypothetical protein